MLMLIMLNIKIAFLWYEKQKERIHNLLKVGIVLTADRVIKMPNTW